MFRRQTSFDTAYVGSSNLSRAALLDGVESNVRLSRVGTPALLEKFRATLDTYWNESSFESYDPDRDRDRLDDALAEASGRTRTTGSHLARRIGGTAIRVPAGDARSHRRRAFSPRPPSESRGGSNRHRQDRYCGPGLPKLCASRDERPSLLFIAHRREILEQSLRTYREVLADASFGELYVGGARPERWRHVFASVQSLSSYRITNIPADAYEIVVDRRVPPCGKPRHIGASLITSSRWELLGLTATPRNVPTASTFGSVLRQSHRSRT